jgi:hypothetical protein
MKIEEEDEKEDEDDFLLRAPAGGKSGRFSGGCRCRSPSGPQ